MSIENGGNNQKRELTRQEIIADVNSNIEIAIANCEQNPIPKNIQLLKETLEQSSPYTKGS